MSVAESVLRQLPSEVEESAKRSAVRAPRAEHLRSEPFVSLARQLFFPPNAPARKSVLLVGADASTNTLGLCQNLAKALAETSRETVAIVQPTAAAGQSTREAVEISPGVWQIASGPWCAQSRANAWGHGAPKEIRSFDFWLFCASSRDADLPTFCGLCDAVVLVLTANVTRREVALSTKNLLLQQKAKLVGAILDQRTLPIPESIYRRL
jgi:hypothetical protein